MESRAAEVPFIALFGHAFSIRPRRSGKQCDGWLLSGSALGNVPRPAEVPFIALFGHASSIRPHRSGKQCDGWLLSGSALGNVPRPAEVPFSILLDARTPTSARQSGPTMLKVAPLGERAVKAGFTRTPEKVTPLPSKRFLRSLPGFASSYAVTGRSVEMTG